MQVINHCNAVDVYRVYSMLLSLEKTNELSKVKLIINIVC